MRAGLAVALLLALAGCVSGGSPTGTTATTSEPATPTPDPTTTPTPDPTTTPTPDPTTTPMLTPTPDPTTTPMLTPTPNGTHVVCGGYPARDTANLSCTVVNGSGYVSPTGANATTG